MEQLEGRGGGFPDPRGGGATMAARAQGLGGCDFAAELGAAAAPPTGSDMVCRKLLLLAANSGSG